MLLFPLYNNLVQGQAYLIITALLLEIFMANKQKRDLLTGFYIAIVFLLKLFPVLILGYFIIRKQYKAVIWSGVMILILLGITCVIVDPNIVFNYYANIVPRLLQNQVIDPFYYGHQSLDIFLKNMFYYDALANPDPVLNFPTLYVLIKSCCVGSLLYLGYSLTKAGDSFKMYSLVVCLIILLSPYLPSYFFIMLLPFTLSIFWFKNRILLFIMVSILCNIPLYLVEDLPLPIKYFRIILLVLTFLFVLYKLHLQINYKVYAFVVAIALVVGFIGFDSTPTSYFIMANEKGIYYDLKISKNSLVVERCLGSKDFSDTLKYAEKIITAKEMDSHPLLTERQGNVKKIFLINDNTLIYLSDIHQGVGMYKVHAQKIR